MFLCNEWRENSHLILIHTQYAFMAWCLVKHKDKFTFTFTLL